MQLLKNYLNRKNLKRYNKVTKEINKIYEKMKEQFANGITAELAQAELRAIRDNNKLKSHQKTIQSIALAKLASEHVLGMPYYDVQIQGALALTDGNIAEMKTGEGKTLTCTAAVVSNFVLGYNTHVVTSNEYLASRDLEILKPLYDFLGLTSACNIKKTTKPEKRQAYQCDVLYSVASELGFDYLRDNLVYKLEDKVQQFDFKQTKVLIDEADSILIDECRTPLIISSDLPDSTGGRHNTIIEIINRMQKMAKEPNPSPLVDEYIPGDFWVDEKFKKSHLSDDGYKTLETLAVEYELVKAPEELYLRQNSWILREVSNAISAKYLYLKNREYIIKDGEVVIIDANTGRIAEGRSWGEGLNQAIEAKEGLEIKPETSSSGTISVQNYFLMYAQISGMSGTIMTSSEEFEFIYNSATIAIPTNKPSKRIDHCDKLYRTSAKKYQDVINEIIDRRKKNQPILLGTVSVAESEIVSNLLNEAKIPHSVLNAKNHHYEAQIIAQAGKPGRVTVSTSMAGRGTDIILGGNKEAFKDILNEQLDIVISSKDRLNMLYNNAYNQCAQMYLNDYEQQLQIIQAINQEQQLENPKNVAEGISNEDLLTQVSERNHQLKSYLDTNFKEIMALREHHIQQQKDIAQIKEEFGENITNEELLAHLEKRRLSIAETQSTQEPIIEDEDDLLAQISGKNKDSLSEAQQEYSQSEQNAVESKKVVENFKSEVEQEAIEQGTSSQNEDLSDKEQLTEDTVLSTNILPESLIEKINSNKKPEIKMADTIASFKFSDEMLHQAASFQKEIQDNPNFQQQVGINPAQFNFGDRDGNFKTTEIIDYQLITPLVLSLYHPQFCSFLIHNGHSFFHRILNVMENTIKHELSLIETESQKWKEQVVKAGGLCVIGCSRNESRRIDNQLIGRAGRQGDPGETMFFLSLEDAWFEVFVKDNPRTYASLVNQLKRIESEGESYISDGFLSLSLGVIQAKREEAHYSGRKQTFQFDSAANDARQGFLKIRNDILLNPSIIKDRLKFAYLEALKPVTHEGFFDHLEAKLKIDGTTLDNIKEAVYNMPLSGILDYGNLYLEDPENNYVIPLIENDREIDLQVKEKIEEIINERIADLTEQEYQEIALMSLQSLDSQWISALNTMDEMNQSVGLRQIAQKNPIYEFKNLCFELFNAIINGFNENLIDNYNHILEVRKHAELLKHSMDLDDDEITDSEVSNEIIFSSLNETPSESISIEDYNSKYKNLLTETSTFEKDLEKEST